MLKIKNIDEPTHFSKSGKVSVKLDTFWVIYRKSEISERRIRAVDTSENGPIFNLWLLLKNRKK